MHPARRDYECKFEKACYHRRPVVTVVQLRKLRWVEPLGLTISAMDALRETPLTECGSDRMEK